VLEVLGNGESEDPALLRALRAAVTEGQPLGEALGALGRSLRAAGDLAPDLRALAVGLATHLAPVSGDATALRTLLAFLGLGHESALAALARGQGGRADVERLRADLKTLLLRAHAALAGLPAEVELRELVARTLSSVEAEQLLNLARERSGEPLVFAFPFPDGEGWTTARLAVSPRRDGEERDAPDAEPDLRLTLGLELSALGPLRADLTFAPRRLSLHLLATRADVAGRIEAELGALRERLGDGRYAVALHVRVGTPAEAALGLHPRDIRYLREHHLLRVAG
jgi:hypothetical protein